MCGTPNKRHANPGTGETALFVITASGRSSRSSANQAGSCRAIAERETQSPELPIEGREIERGPPRRRGDPPPHADPLDLVGQISPSGQHDDRLDAAFLQPLDELDEPGLRPARAIGPVARDEHATRRRHRRPRSVNAQPTNGTSTTAAAA